MSILVPYANTDLGIQLDYVGCGSDKGLEQIEGEIKCGR